MADLSLNAPTPLHTGVPYNCIDRSANDPRLFTIKQVSDASGLPQPVIAQVVPRTWTDAGWMYSTDQMLRAAQISTAVRRGKLGPINQVPCRFPGCDSSD